jgi:hypothetical protein
MARFAESTYAARLSVTKKVAMSRPRARLDAFSEITKKAVATVRFCVKCHTVWSFFSKFPIFLVKMEEKTPFRRTQRVYP